MRLRLLAAAPLSAVTSARSAFSPPPEVPTRRYFSDLIRLLQASTMAPPITLALMTAPADHQLHTAGDDLAKKYIENRARGREGLNLVGYFCFMPSSLNWFWTPIFM
jgi:hypothetical protein